LAANREVVAEILRGAEKRTATGPAGQTALSPASIAARPGGRML